jgi:hypothetical protein
MDNQLRVSSPNIGGLSYYFKDNLLPLWNESNWRNWPHLCVGMDQGSDGMSSGWAMLCYFVLCVTLCWDPSHGGNNDVKKAIDRVGLGDFWKLMMCS